jgi:hypothetical protein
MSNSRTDSTIPCIDHLSVLKVFAAVPTIDKPNGVKRKTCMNDREKIAHRLALLQGVNLSPTNLESIIGELEDLDRLVAELEAFAQDTPWIAQQMQPVGKKV